MARQKTLADALRRFENPPPLPDFVAEREAAAERQGKRLGVLIVRHPRTHQYRVIPTVDGRRVGKGLDAGQGDKPTVYIQVNRALQAAGTAAGLDGAETLTRMHRKEYGVRTRGVPK